MIYYYTGFKDLCDKGFVNQECIEVNANVYSIPSKLGNKVVWYLKQFTSDSLGDEWENSNLLAIGEFRQIPNIGVSNMLTYKEAYAIESKIDDGKPDMGVCRAYGCEGNFGSLCYPLKFGDDDGKRNTRLYFKMDF